MRSSRKQLAQKAFAKALRLRRFHGHAPWDPVCVFDLAEAAGLEVRFIDIPSFEGMYLDTARPVILLSSLRPPGRQFFTCGHELGHHVFGHGEQFDELIDNRSRGRRYDRKEFLADCFAGSVIMPRAAVSRGFSQRSLDPSTAGPTAFFRVASWLGVGYSTLVSHMQMSLGILTTQKKAELLRTKPMDIRSQIIGRECREHLVVADEYWLGRPIDVQVSDLVLAPQGTRVDSACARVFEEIERGCLIQAVSPGMGRVASCRGGWETLIRVSRKNYVGRWKYRFEEEAGDVE